MAFRKPPREPHAGIQAQPTADLCRAWGSILKAVDRNDKKGVGQALYYVFGDIIEAASDEDFRRRLQETLSLNQVQGAGSLGETALLLLSILDTFLVIRGGDSLGNEAGRTDFVIEHDDLKGFTELRFRSKKNHKKLGLAKK